MSEYTDTFPTEEVVREFIKYCENLREKSLVRSIVTSQRANKLELIRLTFRASAYNCMDEIFSLAELKTQERAQEALVRACDDWDSATNNFLSEELLQLVEDLDRIKAELQRVRQLIITRLTENN